MPHRTEHPYYELLEVCGRGGMGVVYKARDKRLNRIVALKFLGFAHSERPEALERFRREAQAIAALNHPNVAIVYEIGEWDDEPFLALEYLSGGTLRDRIKGRQIEVDEILRIAQQLGAGLGFTHQRGILHRDIKPGNSMFSEHGDLKLVDFGLAKFAEGGELTRPGVALGTISYMAPEVLKGAHASVASEVYSFGTLIYELAAGRPMYWAPTTEALYGKILNEPPEPLAKVRPGLPGYLLDAISHATARDPQDRTATIGEVLKELRVGAEASAAASNAPTETVHFERIQPRKKRIVLIAVLSAGLVLAGGAVPWMMHLSPFREALFQRDQTLVVLPFESLTQDAATQALTVGLQDTITSMLSQSGKSPKALLVVPSAEVRRNQVHSIADARKLFNATLALSGAVQKSAGGLQITLSLTDARTVRVQNSTTISLPADASGLQAALADNLAKLVPARSPPATQTAQSGQTTANSTAYALYVQGQGAMNDRKYDQAVNLFQKAVDADPAFALARAKLALAHVQSYMQTKDRISLAKADEEATRAAEAGVTPDVLLARALIREATGDTDQSIALFRQYQQAEPNDVEAYGLLADALNKAGHTQEADDTYQQAIRLRPGYWPTYQRLGVFYLEHQQFEKSERSFLTGIAIAPNIAGLHYNLGALYFMQNRWHDAGAEFEKSLAIHPNGLAYSNLGTVRYFEGKYRESARQFELGAKLQPSNAINWGNLGDALWQLPNERPKAIQAFQQAAVLASEQLGLDATNAELRKNYAVYLAKLGRKEEALAEIQRAIAQAPSDASTQFFAARIYALAGTPDQAVRALKSAIALGYSAGEISHEPDLTPLHSNPAFKQLIGQQAKN